MVCFDAKINFDDSARFRQREIFAMEDTSEGDPREVEAAQYNLSYIGMTGNIGCLGRSSLGRSSLPIHLVYHIATETFAGENCNISGDNLQLTCEPCPFT